MRQFVVFLALAVAAVSGHTIAQPGFPEGRIINGYEAERGEAPYIVSLQSTAGTSFCAASIIRPDVLLTAAHCLTKDTYLAVAAGHSRSNPEDTQVREVTSSRQLIHESYPGQAGPFDIALIFLETPFDLNAVSRDGSSPVASIAMPPKKLEGSNRGTLYGWGKDGSMGLPDILQKLDVDILDYESCIAAMPENHKVVDTNVCTYNAGTTDGACNGDSGGPLISRSTDGSVYQVGVVSWGYVPCSLTRYPSVYTSVYSFESWITDHMDDYSF
ncbi:lectizyme-like [Drosophila pseudoobscura]|uniref:Lectizyme-like n=1 Tax=Drosophila pseudoobscura pseudoobscura TaxID=46245 RepID=A0A6I8VX20_DROPS|nr:lectizyme [Drosophila pseudoobscura]